MLSCKFNWIVCKKGISTTVYLWGVSRDQKDVLFYENCDVISGMHWKKRTDLWVIKILLKEFDRISFRTLSA